MLIKKFLSDKILWLKTAIVLIFIITLIIPLCSVFAYLPSVKVAEIFLSDAFIDATVHSILTALTSAIISMFIAFFLAYAIIRSNIRFKGIFAVLITIPMLIPTVSIGMGINVLFGESGLLTTLFQTSSISGFSAIVIGSVLYSLPSSFLMFFDILKYEDHRVYQVADVMGISKFHQFTGLTFRYLKKPIISIFFATFTLIFTDYGIPMMVGGRYTTLPLYMFKEVIGQLNFGVGSVVALVLLVPAIVSNIIDAFCKESTSVGETKEIQFKKSTKRDVCAYTFIIASLVLLITPILIFVIIGFVTKYPIDMSFSLNSAATAFNMKAGQYLLNSLLIAIGVAVIGTILSYTIAYLTSRTTKKGNVLLHFLSMASLAIPGLVLGLSYSLTFKGSFLAGTIIILILVNIVHFFSSPYLLAYNAFQKVNKNYETIAKTLQIDKYHFFKSILIPETLSTILEMFSFYFINSMITISAVSFLAVTANKPIALLINEFEAYMLIESAAFVSFLILLINVLVKFSVYLFQRRKIKNAK